MAGNEVRIKASVTGNAKQEIGGIRDAWQRFQREGGQGVKAGLTAAAAAKGFGLLDTALSSTISIMGDASKAASNLEQSQGAVDSVFKDSAEVITAWGEDAAEAAGLSQRAVNEMAAVTGAQLKSMGFSLDEAAEKSITLQKRAADLAATFGGPTEDAIQAISALLRGERDPIERYGVSIKDVDVKARIAAKGLDTSTAAAQKNSSAIAALELLLEQTSDAQGQFARETESAAGSQARSAAKIENSLAHLGEVTLPLVAAGADFAADGIEGLTIALDALGDWIAANGDAWEAIKPHNAVPEMLDRTGAAAREAGRAFGDMGKDLDDVKPLLRGTAGGLEDVADGAAHSADKTQEAARAAEELEDALDDAADAAYDAASAFGDQAYDADQLKGRMAELEEEIGDAKDELRELEAIKNPTKDQQTDIVILRGKLAELREDLFGTRLDLAKLDGTGLDSLLKELANAQYRTDLLGDEAREALDLFRKLSFAAKNAPGYRSDPGYAPRAEGGPVSKGEMYLVGEKGPELFVPNSSGQIYPNGGGGPMMPSGGGGGGWGGGGPTVIVNVHAQGVMTPAIAQQLRDELGPVLAPIFQRR